MTTLTFWRFRCAVLIIVTADIVRSSAIECGRAPKSFIAMAFKGIDKQRANGSFC